MHFILIAMQKAAPIPSSCTQYLFTCQRFEESLNDSNPRMPRIDEMANDQMRVIMGVRRARKEGWGGECKTM